MERVVRIVTMDKLLKDLRKLQKEVSTRPDKSWIWDDKEIRALKIVIEAVSDCV